MKSLQSNPFLKEECLLEVEYGDDFQMFYDSQSLYLALALS